MFLSYVVDCLFFLPPLRGSLPSFFSLPSEGVFLLFSPSPGGRELEGGGGFSVKSVFEGIHPHPDPLPERVRGKETATGDEYTTLAVTK